jgi:hypothetical protein
MFQRFVEPTMEFYLRPAEVARDVGKNLIHINDFSFFVRAMRIWLSLAKSQQQRTVDLLEKLSKPILLGLLNIIVHTMFQSLVDVRVMPLFRPIRRLPIALPSSLVRFALPSCLVKSHILELLLGAREDIKTVAPKMRALVEEMLNMRGSIQQDMRTAIRQETSGEIREDLKDMVQRLDMGKEAGEVKEPGERSFEVVSQDVNGVEVLRVLPPLL